MKIKCKVLAVIPARGGSREIPKKNLRKVGSLSLIGHAIKFCQNCKFLYGYVVSTDCPKIMSEAKKIGACNIIKRPKKLSGDTSTSEKAWKHALLAFEKEKKTLVDFSILLEPTCPQRNQNEVKKCLNLVINQSKDLAFSVNRVPLKFNPKKQLYIKNGIGINVLKKKLSPIRQQARLTFIRNGECYAASRKFIISSKNVMSNKAGVVISKNEPINIDTFEDLKKAKQNLKYVSF